MTQNAKIQLAPFDNCTGCAACASVCPTKSITMLEDREGFLQPHIDTDVCIGCHKCEKTCPIVSTIEIPANFETQAFAAINKDEAIRAKSSSGGMFHALAKWTIEQGGVVFGARFDENWDVVHDYTETIEGIEPFMRSKYVQSRIGETFKQTKLFLEEGRWVLYVGTSCQIGGLQAYLGKNYDTLVKVDLVCHGVPSPKVWKEYVNEEIGVENLHHFCFRDKGNGWVDFQCALQIKTESPNIRYESMHSNVYMIGFMNNVYLRKCCYQCSFKGNQSAADISLADSWGVQNYLPEMNDDKGTSLVIVRTKQGGDIISSLSGLKRKVVKLSDAAVYNERIEKSVTLTKHRYLFFFFNRFLSMRKSLHVSLFLMKYWNKTIKKSKKILKITR